jgi:hypothetical protein
MGERKPKNPINLDHVLVNAYFFAGPELRTLKRLHVWFKRLGE